MFGSLIFFEFFGGPVGCGNEFYGAKVPSLGCARRAKLVDNQENMFHGGLMKPKMGAFRRKRSSRRAYEVQNGCIEEEKVVMEGLKPKSQIELTN
ncbi:hypothetical protein [Cytobacillus pseudoceanisediminis]|uniref:hypothetical protein n=1 Tax=Cytobacillus pseudoceanisediminis TaxID=3051614 RepID=UPI003C2F6C28